MTQTSRCIKAMRSTFSGLCRTDRSTASSRVLRTGSWGLRDYGVPGQLGLEGSPDEYVASMVTVFAEVRRVLADSGTCWLNLGDSYNSGSQFNHDKPGSIGEREGRYSEGGETWAGHRPRIVGLKPKDLVGIPWAVAEALRDPYYTGRIALERDRVWLAATIDAEGSICGFTHERADGDGIRTGVHITITNTSMPLLAEAQRIWPTSRDDGNAHGPSALGTRECRRWIAHNVDDKADLLRELYPYLIAKKTQALLAWNFLEMSRVSKRIGKMPEGEQAKERRAWIVGALSELNHGRAADVPAWIIEPPSLFEPGWYLRSDIIWTKPNPMPESVTDRPTKAHEYLFLLSKRPSYYFNQEAVREPFQPKPENAWRYDYPAYSAGGEKIRDQGEGASGSWLQSYVPPACGPDGRRITRVEGRDGSEQHRSGERWPNPNGRNVRSVWEIPTQPYPEAHFATFPEELVRRCILAGCAEGGTVLDPFVGSGTTCAVARKHGRRSIGIDLSAPYLELAAKRLQQLSLLSELSA